MKNLVPWIVASVALTTFASNHCRASTVAFLDGNFDLADYQVNTLQPGGGAVTVARITSGGNPGAHLRITTDAPASPADDWVSRTYLISSSFAYDPGASGRIVSIDLSLDVSATLPPPPFNFLSNGTRFVVEQAGNYFAYGVQLPLIQNSYLTASAFALSAQDFNRVVDLRLGTTDPTLHPDFSAGTLRFGISPAVFVSGTSAQSTLIFDFDNLSFTLSTVPELPAAAFLIWGLPLVAIARWKRACGSQRPRA